MFRSGLFFVSVQLLLLLQGTEGWFALTKAGYRIKGNLTNEGHVHVLQNIKLDGVHILGQGSVMDQPCDGIRRGSLRYNHSHVELCSPGHGTDRSLMWRPISFCNYTCKPRDLVPCGVQVTSSCGDMYECVGQFGLGINLQQCAYNAPETDCGDPVYDNCGNFCGLRGRKDCERMARRTGGLDIFDVGCDTAGGEQVANGACFYNATSRGPFGCDTAGGEHGQPGRCTYVPPRAPMSTNSSLSHNSSTFCPKFNTSCTGSMNASTTPLPLTPVENSTALYRFARHATGGLLLQVGTMTLEYAQNSSILINNLTKIRGGPGVPTRRFTLTSVLESTPLAGRGVRLEGVVDDAGGVLVLGSPPSLRNATVVVDGDFSSTEDMVLGDGHEDIITVLGRISASASLNIQGAGVTKHDTQRVSLPALAGADAAVRRFLINKAPAIPLLADHARWGSVLHPIHDAVLDEGLCCTLAASMDIPTHHALVQFALRRGLIRTGINGSVEVVLHSGEGSDVRSHLHDGQYSPPTRPKAEGALDAEPEIEVEASPSDVFGTQGCSNFTLVNMTKVGMVDRLFGCVPEIGIVPQLLSMCDPVATAAIFKCAALSWLPSHLDYGSEAVLPETSGVMLSTGNLEDITVDAGHVSGLGVRRELEVDGTTRLGLHDDSGVGHVEVQAPLLGAEPLSFTGQTNSAHDDVPRTRLAVAEPSATDNIVGVPDSSGMVLTTDDSPPVSRLSVMAGLQAHGTSEILGNVTLGVDSNLDFISVGASVVGSVQMAGDLGKHSDARTVLVTSEPSRGESFVTLPDESGVVVVAGGSAPLVDQITVTDSSRLEGKTELVDTVAVGEDVDDDRSRLHANAPIAGAVPLHFDAGTGASQRAHLAISAPSSGDNTAVVPDADGTMVLTGETVPLESVSVYGSLVAEGKQRLLGSIQLGDEEDGVVHQTKLAMGSATLQGQFPLRLEGEDGHGTVTLNVPALSSDVVIGFPDSGGTLVTTESLPAAWVVDGSLAFGADRVQIDAESIGLGSARASEAKRGSFLFGDSSSPSFQGARDNEFAVRALGGVRFITGPGDGGEGTGVKLEPGGAGWMVLSDRSMKVHVKAIADADALKVVTSLPSLYTWAYKGSSDRRHIGAMADDWAKATAGLGVTGGSDNHISTVDVDGVLLSSVRSLAGQLEDAQSRIKAAEQSRRDFEQRVDEQERLSRQHRSSLESRILDLEAKLALVLDSCQCANTAKR